jgi:hypothetical protein
MLIAVYGSCMIAIFPESTVALFALIIFLSASSSYQLNGSGDGISMTAVYYQKVYMVEVTI